MRVRPAGQNQDWVAIAPNGCGSRKRQVTILVNGAERATPLNLEAARACTQAEARVNPVSCYSSGDKFRP